MIEYVYYKLYQLVLKGSLRDIPHIMTPIFFCRTNKYKYFGCKRFIGETKYYTFLFLR